MNFIFRLHSLTFALMAILLFQSSGANAEGVWHESYNDAVAEAKKEGKNVLIVFTGTDWIEMCQIFYDSVLSQDDFTSVAGKEFALLKLEYAKDNIAKKEVALQNQLLKDAYRVKGFPTLVITDTGGRPFGINGYQPVTAAKYGETVLGMGALLKEKTAKLKEAEGLTGLDKAKVLGAAIPDLPGNLAARYFSKEMKEVIAGDPENTAGFNEEFERMVADVEYSKQMQLLAKEVEWVKMLKLTDQYIADNKLEGEAKQAALMNKYGVQVRVNDPAGIIQSLFDVVQVDPKSDIGKNAKKILEKWRAQVIEDQLVP